jgi:error-prone DNA polymerase
VFVSLEDETGVSNAIVDPDLFERYRLLITEEDFLVIEGEVQNSENVVLIKTHAIKPLLHLPAVATALQAGDEFPGSESHDFR